jgi:hypothetical protein
MFSCAELPSSCSRFDPAQMPRSRRTRGGNAERYIDCGLAKQRRAGATLRTQGAAYTQNPKETPVPL